MNFSVSTTTTPPETSSASPGIKSDLMLHIAFNSRKRFNQMILTNVTSSIFQHHAQGTRLTFKITLAGQTTWTILDALKKGTRIDVKRLILVIVWKDAA